MANIIVRNKVPSRNMRNWSSIDEFESLVNRFFNNTGYCSSCESEMGVPIELIERDENLILKAHLPGLRKENINIEISEKSVNISGEYRSEREENRDLIYRSEFYEGSFERSIALPQKINHQKSKADYCNGVLTLTMPKSEKETDKVIRLTL